ncbi:hypothetical protein C5167_040889, partial [Papaver somniferum]
MELEKKKVECTELQGELTEVEETRMSTAEEENAIEFWRKKCSYLESEIGNSTMGCVESRVCNLVSLDPRNGKESSILRCQELSYSEMIESEVPGLLNEITQSGESNMSKPTTSRGGSAKFWTKEKNVERTAALKSLTKTRASKRRKMVTEGDQTTDSITEGGSPEVQTKMKNVKRIKGFEEPVIELESMELYKSNCFELSMELKKNKEELEKNKVELEKMKVELEKNKGKLAEIESEMRGLQNEITQTGEKQRDKNNMRKPNAETRGGGSKDPRVYELKTEEKVLNVEEGKGWGCLEERPCQQGSSSQADPQICKRTFGNMVSDSNDGGDSLSEFEDSHGGSMVMLAMKNLNTNKDKMKWNSEGDMLFSFEEDSELCMKAVCVFYRQEISEDEISPKGLVIDSDMLRCITLAKFLLEGDCKGDLKKSFKELETLDSEAVDDCKRLARSYSK